MSGLDCVPVEARWVPNSTNLSRIQTPTSSQCKGSGKKSPSLVEGLGPETSQLNLGSGIRVRPMLVHRAAVLAYEGLIPPSVPLRVGSVVVSPNEKQQQDEDASRNQTKDCQWSRDQGCCVGRNSVDIKDDPAEAKKHETRPEHHLPIRPFHWRTQFLG